MRRAFTSLAAPAATRGFACTAVLRAPKVKVTFINADKTEKTVEVVAGATLMEAARDNRIDMEAACDGTCACSTCHVYVRQDFFDKLPKPSEDELDMLDLAIAPKPNSRLACQVDLTADLDGLVAEMPDEVSNQLV